LALLPKAHNFHPNSQIENADWRSLRFKYNAIEVGERLKQEGIDVGLINKATLNVIDEETMAKVGKAPFVIVTESFNRKTGLGARFGSWLLERGYTPKYAHLGTHKEGCGGLWEQFPYQGIDPVGIMSKVKELAK
jgi:transketolase C-terminal domain/subunit